MARQRTKWVRHVLRCLWHNSNVLQQDGAHTGSTWTAGGSQAGKDSRKGVDEGHTPAPDSIGKCAEPLRTPRVLPPVHASHLLGEPCADSLPVSVWALTASRTIAPASTVCRAGSSLSEACESSLRGSCKISSAMEPTSCHPCCSSTLGGLILQIAQVASTLIREIRGDSMMGPWPDFMHM